MIRARVYGGGAPATGEEARLAIVGETLEVHLARHTHAIPLSVLSIRDVGFEKPGLELAWDSPDGTCAAQVLDADAVRSLRADATFNALPQVSALRATLRRRALGRSVGWTALGLFIFFPVLIILLFVWQADRIAHAAARRISIADEIKLGDGAYASMSESLKLVDSGPAYEVLQTLGRRLTQGSKYTYRIHVAENDLVNAFALPGGIIVVHTGLIDATRRPEELAGVLAHEIQHIERRHSLVAVIKDTGLRGLWLLVTGDVGGGLLGRTALELTALSFSRQAEAEADAHGFDTLVAHRIDPNGMPDFFQVLGKQDGAAPPPFLSTHPASADREEQLRLRIKALPRRDFEKLDFGPWPPAKEAR